MKLSTRMCLLTILLFLCSLFAHSALSPSMLKSRDLTTLIEFIVQHPKVADTLEYIDVVNYIITFDEGCKAYFERPSASIFALSRPGPQPMILRVKAATLTTRQTKQTKQTKQFIYKNNKESAYLAF